MKKYYFIFLLLGTFLTLQAQIITQAETERIIKTLASDAFEGRKTFTAGIEKAANFISNEFASMGIGALNGDNQYLQSFAIIRPKFLGLTCSIEEQPIDTKNVVVITIDPEVTINQTSGYEVASIGAGENLLQAAYQFINRGKKIIVFVDETLGPNFNKLVQFKNNLAPNQSTVVFILSNKIPNRFTIDATHRIDKMPLSNVVAMIPGKSIPNEYVIFSGHYDHLGINSKRAVDGDSIFNGANDDAAGTTAMLLLAKHYKTADNNQRTLVFAAFTAEEVGGYGAQYFSKQLDPTKVVAMFNIEMIGTESKWGRNSAYITGFEKSSMGTILQSNLKGSSFSFYPDPYPEQNLFYRSDNATLARLGVPAHTISTSKMDAEPNYHKPSDEVKTLDLENMTEIIKAIAISAASIVSGKDTPTRVDTAKLK